jgi:VWFA-related protein
MEISTRTRSALPRLGVRFRFFSSCVFLFFATHSYGQNSCFVHFINTSIQDSVVLSGLSAHFPHPVLSKIEVKDSLRRYIHRLADTKRWLSPTDTAENGQVVSSIWNVLTEHYADPSLPSPRFTDIQKSSPPYQVIELGDMGLSVALVMDYSGSMYDSLPNVVESGKVFVEGMRSYDQAAIMQFSKKCVLVNSSGDFTSDKGELNAALDLNKSDYAGTYVYSAIDTALTVFRTSRTLSENRRVVIVYTDGRDHNKGVTADTVIARAKRDSIPVFTISIHGVAGDGVGGPNDDILKTIAHQTGGEFYKTYRVDSLVYIYEKIRGLIQGYYVLAHSSPHPFTDGTRRQVDLTYDFHDMIGATPVPYHGSGSGFYDVPLIRPNVTTAIAASKPAMAAGDTVTFQVTITNNGRGDAAETRVAFTPGDSLAVLAVEAAHDTVDTVSLDRVYFYRIGASESRIVRITARLRSKMPMGDTPIESLVRIECTDDSLGGDNTAQATVIGQGRPELSVSIHPFDRILSPGVGDSLSVTIRNLGDADASLPFEAALVQRAGDASAQIKSIPFLAALDSAVVWFHIQYPEYGEYPVLATVDGSARIPERNEVDNADEDTILVGLKTLTVRIGDVSTADLVRGKQARFHQTVLLTVNALDQNDHAVHRLANAERWLDAASACEAGPSVGTVWTALDEVNLAASDYRPDSNVQPGLEVTEIRGSGIAVALVIDRSSDVSAWASGLRSRVGAFVDGFGSGDRGSSIRFDQSVTALVPLTSDKAALRGSLDQSHSGSGRVLYDAVAAGIESVRPAAGRNAVVVITGGGDNGSAMTLDGTVLAAREAGVPVYCVELVGANSGDPENRTLAETTGGWFHAAGSDSALAAALEQVEETLRDYYVIGYTAPDSTQDRNWRQVRLGMTAYGKSSADTTLYRAPLGRANLAVRLTARTEASPQTGADSVRTDGIVHYAVQVRNHGHRNLAGISLRDVIPDNFRHTTLPDPGTLVRGDTLSWTLASLAVRGVADYAFDCVAETLHATWPIPRVNRVHAFCSLDSIPGDDRDSVTVTYIPLLPPDAAVEVIGTAETQGGPTDSLGAGGAATYRLTVTNRGELSCRAVRVRNVIPSGMTLESSTAPPDSQPAGVLCWTVPFLASRTGSWSVSFGCRITKDLPPYSVAVTDSASAAMDPANEVMEVNFTNNRSQSVLHTLPRFRPIPEIQLAPDRVEPGDSVQIQVMSHVEAVSWRIVAGFENGDSVVVFSASYPVARLDTGLWIPLDRTPFTDTRMRTDKTEETVTLVFETTDKWGVCWRGSDTFVIGGKDEVLLDRNVFRPGESEPLGIRFKLSSNRRADIVVYDASGAFIRELAADRFPAGWNALAWDGSDDQGRKAGSGIYVILVRSGELQHALKCILVR